MRLGVVSPFVDRRHGTERALAELLERLARDFGWEIHLYAQRVEGIGASRDLPVSSPEDRGVLVWHRVPGVPGPHLFQFVWWYWLNRLQRWLDARFRGLSLDLVYSPGINCGDADAITVHACFHAMAEAAAKAPDHLGGTVFVRRLHRALYYRLLCALERRRYADRKTSLAAVSPRTAEEVGRRFGRQDVSVIPNGVDLAVFHREARCARRKEARRALGFQDADFVVLLIGNDWRVKGLPVLLAAVGACRVLPVHLLAVGEDDRRPHRAHAARLNLSDRLHFAEPAADVLKFYAAADLYASPTFEDSFALPALEAMACGVPVILSRRAGLSAWLEHGTNALLLEDPQNAEELATHLRQLYKDPSRRERLGENAVRAAQAFSWDQNAQDVRRWLESVAKRKKDAGGSR